MVVVAGAVVVVVDGAAMVGTAAVVVGAEVDGASVIAAPPGMHAAIAMAPIPTIAHSLLIDATLSSCSTR